MRRRIAIAAGLVAVLCIAAACGEDGRMPTEIAPPGNSDATFSRVQREVFTPQCAIPGCHGGTAANAQENMPLGEGLSYDAIVRVPSRQMPSLLRVAPGDPANSYLVRKITPGSAIAGAPMPFGATISDADRQLVRDWVARGAPRD
jgi:hypothetical protein